MKKTIMPIKFCDESIDVKLNPTYIKLGVLFSNPKCSICHDYRIKKCYLKKKKQESLERVKLYVKFQFNFYSEFH